MDVVWQVVVQVGEGDFVLCPDRLSDDDLVDVIELIPVFIPVGETGTISYGTTYLASVLDVLYKIRLPNNYKKHVLNRKWRKSPTRPFTFMSMQVVFLLCRLHSPLKLIVLSLQVYHLLKPWGPYWRLMSLTSGSNFGPPGMAIFKALEVKKALRSNR